MYVDPSIEGYVLVDYFGLFITKRKATAEFEENRPTTQQDVYTKRGLQTCSGSVDVLRY